MPTLGATLSTSSVVDKAGDTMTGALTFTAGSLSLGGAGYLPDTNLAVASPGGFKALTVNVNRKGGGYIADASVGVNTLVVDDPNVKRGVITAASNATPIVITSVGHGLQNGDVVAISAVGGNTNANGKFTVANKTNDTFELAGSAGNSAYTSGGVFTSAGALYGNQVVVFPRVTRQFGVGGGPSAFGDDVIGVPVYNSGTVYGTAAFNAGSTLGSGGGWRIGVQLDADYNFGFRHSGGTVANAGISLEGTYSLYGIDFASGSYTTFIAMRLKNSTYISALNNAGNTNLSLIGLNSSDQVAFDNACRFNAGFTVANTFNITFSTSTGSKIGTATGEKFAFHNATPVIQRAGAAQAAVATTAATNTTPYGFTTAAQADAIVTLVNEIRAALVEKGLIKGAA
jgi:hypothetical protein